MHFITPFTFLAIATTALAAPSILERTIPPPPPAPIPAQETTCSQNIGVQSCCNGPVTEQVPSAPFYASLLTQDPRYASVLGFLQPLLDDLLGGVLNGGLGGLGGDKVGVAQQCTSTAVFSTLSGGTFINCGSAKPKCCIAPDNHVNSPTTTVNKGLIVTDIKTGDLVVCPDITLLGS